MVRQLGELDRSIRRAGRPALRREDRQDRQWRARRARWRNLRRPRLRSIRRSGPDHGVDATGTKVAELTFGDTLDEQSPGRADEHQQRPFFSTSRSTPCSTEHKDVIGLSNDNILTDPHGRAAHRRRRETGSAPGAPASPASTPE